MRYKLFLCLLSLLYMCYECNNKIGPDPWNYDNNEILTKLENDDIPPDLRITPKKKQSDSNLGIGEWFFKRLMTIVLKGNQKEQGDDDGITISLQMKFDKEKWKILDEYMSSSTPLSEQMFRRSIGYIEEAIYKPTIKDKIIMAWSEYIQAYLIEYKIYITWTASLSAAIISLIWLWNRMSHRHIIITAFALLYFYEVFISYKEAEKQELDRFLSAINTCKWYFWTSSCEIPPPDPLIFLKHMSPLKIGIRMFTTLISEPMITISATVKIMIHGIADGLWFPFDKIVYGILVVTFNVLLIFLLIMIIFNYIFNIPFHLSFLAGLVSIGLNQRNRTVFTNADNNQIPRTEHDNRISGATLDRLLDVFSQAINNVHNNKTNNPRPITTLRRSASTGRLHNIATSETSNIRRRNQITLKNDGSGDA